MRRRISRALLATAATGAAITTLGFAAATSAGAATTGAHTGASHKRFAPSGGPPIYTPPCSPNATGFRAITSPPVMNVLDRGGCAGYVATGRNFRFARALIRIPARPVLQRLAGPALPAEYVGLSSNDSIAALGVMSCDVYDHIFGTPPPGAPGGSCAAPTPTWWAVGLVARQHGAILEHHQVALENAFPGEGIQFSVYEEPTGNAIHMTVDASGAGGPIDAFYFNAHGAVFDHADALVDFSGSAVTVPPSMPLFDLRITQFLRGAFTTASGQRGTFVGPWRTQPVSITFPGGHAPPYNTVTVEPSFLYNDGMGNGWGDAFGVWWRH